jgi:ribosomal protein S6--L-glutamate ligase
MSLHGLSNPLPIFLFAPACPICTVPAISNRTSTEGVAEVDSNVQSDIHQEKKSGAACRTLSIAVLAEQRYLSQSQPGGLVTSLRSHGHSVTVIDPQSACYEVGDHRWLAGFDLVVARGRSWAVLCLLSWAEARGIPTVNRRTAIAAVHNKAEMAVTLSSGRLRTPRTLLGTTQHLAQCAGTRYPFVLKPVFGDNGHGLLLVNSREEMQRVTWPEPVALAQQFVPGKGCDLKIYGIGDDVWAVRKPGFLQPGRGASPHSPREHGAESAPMTTSLRRLAHRCRTLFGLELYGLDCIETPQGPVVIEVNEFPNYSGIPEASERLAEYVVRRAGHRRKP